MREKHKVQIKMLLERIWLTLTVIVVALSAALIASQHSNNGELAALAGAVCGLVVAIPTSLLILAITRR